VWSFLHESSLSKLLRAGLISDEMVTLSQEIRKRWLELQKRSWEIGEIKTSIVWRELFELCDRVKSKSKQS
jgi:hypothetical protein